MAESYARAGTASGAIAVAASGATAVAVEP
ncbi:hypothetical protein QFZ65_003552 [Arthrobacter sp. B3I9]|nr:hypothetical protein [Arthrobacter sp. B3I9]